VSVHGDGDPVSYGCALAFIYYLTVQLGLSINEVIAQYNNNLASCYHAVTGDAADPFPAFMALVNHLFPPGVPATTSGSNLLTTCFRRHSRQLLRAEEHVRQGRGDGHHQPRWRSDQPGVLGRRRRHEQDGVPESRVQWLAPFTGAFAQLRGQRDRDHREPDRRPVPERRPPKSPQRIWIPFDITLSNALLSQFPASGTSGELDLSTTLTSGGTTVSGSSATMDFELIAAGDPYFANINPQQNNQPYLSQDLRVFSVAPAFNDTPINGAPRFTDHSFTGAYSWIQALLGYLNSTPSFTNPAGDDAFALLPGQADEGQTDSSVAPFAP
jgi:hypothetical protein